MDPGADRIDDAMEPIEVLRRPWKIASNAQPFTDPRNGGRGAYGLPASVGFAAAIARWDGDMEAGLRLLLIEAVAARLRLHSELNVAGLG